MTSCDGSGREEEHSVHGPDKWAAEERAGETDGWYDANGELFGRESNIVKLHSLGLDTVSPRCVMLHSLFLQCSIFYSIAIWCWHVEMHATSSTLGGKRWRSALGVIILTRFLSSME